MNHSRKHVIRLTLAALALMAVAPALLLAEPAAPVKP